MKESNQTSSYGRSLKYFILFKTIFMNFITNKAKNNKRILQKTGLDLDLLKAKNQKILGQCQHPGPFSKLETED